MVLLFKVVIHDLLIHLQVIDVEKKTVWYLDPLYQNPNNRNQNTAEKAMMRFVSLQSIEN